MMTALVFILKLYLAAGLAWVIVRQTWRDAIYGVREGRGIENQFEVPTPWFPAVLALLIGLPMDALCWPYNEWAIRQPPLDKEEG